MVEPPRGAGFPRGPWRLALSWDESPGVHAGERWQLLLRARSLDAAAGPGAWLDALRTLRQRLHGHGRVIGSPLDARVAPAPRSLDALRERLAATMSASIVERDAAALVIALGVGDTQRVSREQWRVFNAIGITHLVAISGLHVTLFCVVVAWLCARLWGWLPWLYQRVPRHSFAAAAGVAASCGYALLAGWSVPTQRTLIMLACWHGLRIAARPRPAARTLAVGLAGVLLPDPLAPLAAGFWLSFLAVSALLLHGRLAPAAGGWKELLHTQGYVIVALLPVTVAVFGTVSLAGLAVNLLAIPLFSFVLVPLILGGIVAALVAPALAPPAFRAAAAVVRFTWPAARAVAGQPLALLHFNPAPWWYLLAAAALACLLLPWRAWMRSLAVLALLPAAWPVIAGPEHGHASMHELGGARASAVLVRTAGHALLYDVGESWGDAGAAAAGRLVPRLRQLGVRRLDAVLLPRLDADRGAGILALAAHLSLGRLASGDGHALPPEFTPCNPGEKWSWDGVDFEIVDGVGCRLQVRAADARFDLPAAQAAGRRKGR